jgi:hypothetical protein
MRKIPSKKEKLKPKSEIKPNFVETEYDLSYLNILGISTIGLTNPTLVRVYNDGRIIILDNGKTEEW